MRRNTDHFILATGCSHYKFWMFLITECFIRKVSSNRLRSIGFCWMNIVFRWSCLWRQTVGFFMLFSIQRGSEMAKRRIMLWLRQMPARQPRFTLGYPCSAGSLFQKGLNVFCSPRWGMKQIASRHAKSVTWGPETLSRLGRPGVYPHSTGTLWFQ